MTINLKVFEIFEANVSFKFRLFFRNVETSRSFQLSCLLFVHFLHDFIFVLLIHLTKLNNKFKNENFINRISKGRELCKKLHR